MTDDPGARPAAEPVDALARQLVGALVSALVLLLPLRGALGATTNERAVLWLFGGLLLAALVGWLLERIGVPRPYGTCLTTAGLFAVATLAGLTLVALLGDPGDDTELSLLVGLPAAALAVVGAMVVLGRSPNDEVVIAATVGGFVLALAASSAVDGLVQEARDDAADVEAFVDAGLTPYLPELEELTARFGGTYRARPEAGGAPYITGYDLYYYAESQEREWETAHVVVDVELADGEAWCEESTSYTCVEGDGYAVRESNGEVEAVVAGHGDMRLEAVFRDGDGALPSPEEVGRALAEAEIVEWDDVVGLDD